MRIIRLSYGIKGFVRLARYSLKWLYMLTDKAKYKAKVLSFWTRHGLAATLDAFPVKRATLFLWKQKVKQGNGSFESLNELTKAPKMKRKRLWSLPVIAEIKRLRLAYPNLGKEKIHTFLIVFCQKKQLKCPKPRTIGRLIKDDGGMRTFPQKVSHFGKAKPVKRVKKNRKPKDFKPTLPGQLIEMDSIERREFGLKRYVITFVDTYSRFTFAWGYTGHGSDTAKDFLKKIKIIFPFRIQHIQTDNGSEFAKHFAKEIFKEQITHYHTYPRCPKMNAHCERFNRTIQEEYIDYHANELLNMDKFNTNLMNYLVWYNTQRPHWSLNLKSPIQFITSQDIHLSKSGWPDTIV